jgi:hypothetical protein
MPHNFFLYGNPDNGDKLEWIPWDNNEALVSNNRSLSMKMTLNDDDWPLIGYILNESEYQTAYEGYIEDFAKRFFNGGTSTEYNVNDDFDDYQTLIEDFVRDEGYSYTFTSYTKFSTAVGELKDHTTARYNSAYNYVGW